MSKWNPNWLAIFSDKLSAHQRLAQHHSRQVSDESLQTRAVETLLIKSHHYIAEVRLKANEELDSIWKIFTTPPTMSQRLFNCSWRWCFTAASNAFNSCWDSEKNINLGFFLLALPKWLRALNCFWWGIRSERKGHKTLLQIIFQDNHGNIF